MEIFELFVSRYVYFMIILLMAVGIYAMLGKRNLFKMVVGAVIFQTAIYIFYIQGATKLKATVPIIDEQFGAAAHHYINPLPHVLILTAIVVGISLLGVALALLIAIYRRFKTLDDKAITARMKEMGD